MSVEKSGRSAMSIVMSCSVCHKEFPEGTATCPHDGMTLVQAIADPLIGSTFERYEIVQILGRGGMSVVYKARQKLLNNFVAIKVLHPQLGADPANLERFIQEGKAVVTLKHPNIIQMFDCGISEGKAFLIMEYLEGVTLAQELEKLGYMPTARALNLFFQTCDGLEHAHSKGVIHRDLKPSNLVLIEEPGKVEQVKIVDFGIAKLTPQDGSSPQNLTASGEVFGSPL